MILHSNVKELHEYFPKLQVPENEGIFKLNDGSDKVAFIILPINGGKPVHVSNGYPQDKFDEEFVQVLYRYYKYPPERDDDLLYKSYATMANEIEEQMTLGYLRFKVLYTAIVLALAFGAGFFILLAQPPLYFWAIYVTAVFIWIIFIWKDRKGRDL